LEQWQRVKRLVDEALALDDDRRRAFLDEACAGQPALRSEVDSLLRYEGGAELETDPGVGSDLAGSRLGH
jgi:hypothetical protein